MTTTFDNRTDLVNRLRALVPTFHDSGQSTEYLSERIRLAGGSASRTDSSAEPAHRFGTADGDRRFDSADEPASSYVYVTPSERGQCAVRSADYLQGRLDAGDPDVLDPDALATLHRSARARVDAATPADRRPTRTDSRNQMIDPERLERAFRERRRNGSPD